MLSTQTCEPPADSVLVQMSNGGFTRVDPDVAEWLRGRRVHKSSEGYAKVRLNGRLEYVHRLVMPPASGTSRRTPSGSFHWRTCYV